MLLRKARTEITSDNVSVLSFLEMMNSVLPSYFNEERRETVRDYIIQNKITRKDITKYKYATSNYYKMAEGIMVGKLRDGYVKIHALGSKENKGDWKARFFVGGTMVRKNSRGDKGLIEYNSAIDDGMKNANTILSTYVKNTLNN